MSSDTIESAKFTPDVDPFLGEEFIDRNAPLPTVIVLNNQMHCGYFIPVGTMAKCGWKDFNAEQLITHTFGSGETEEGILITQPRMLVCPKTDLYQYDLKASGEQRTRVVVGLYDAARKDDLNIRTERLYLVFFLDENNEPLHTSPLKYAARGVNGATFEMERRAFKGELEVCHVLATSAATGKSVAAKPKTDLYHSLGVFCFSTKAELVGEKPNKSWCCRVVGHEKPMVENWKDYFLGYTQWKDYIWSALEPLQCIDVRSQPVIEAGTEKLALPAGDNFYPPVSDEQAAVGKASLFPPESGVSTSVHHPSTQALATAPVNETSDIPF